MRLVLNRHLRDDRPVRRARRPRCAVHRAALATFTLMSCLLATMVVTLPRAALAQIQFAEGQPVAVEADYGQLRHDGSGEVWLLTGKCRLTHGATIVRSNTAVLWVEQGRYGER